MAPRGYIHGDTAAAKYLGLSDRKALRKWQEDASLPLRELLEPRIIRGHRYYKVANLDRFMDPALNESSPTTTRN